MSATLDAQTIAVIRAVITDAQLVRMIQSAILGGGMGTQGPEDLRLLLILLEIPANQPRQPDAFERVRKCILRSGCTVNELRQALGDLCITGGGGGGDPYQAIADIRAGILTN